MRAHFASFKDTVGDLPPSRIFNVDETMIDFFLDKRGVNVIAGKGAKRVDMKRKGKGMSHISLVLCVSAAGQSIAPTFILEGKKIVEGMISKDAPAGSGFMLTPSGWMLFLNG